MGEKEGISGYFIAETDDFDGLLEGLWGVDDPSLAISLHLEGKYLSERVVIRFFKKVSFWVTAFFRNLEIFMRYKRSSLLIL